MVDRAPQVYHLAVELHDHLVEMPSPVPEPAHVVDPPATNLAGKERTEPIPPQAHGLVAKVVAALEQEILDIPQRQRKSDIQHHHQPDHFRRRVETPKRAWRKCSGFAAHAEAIPPPGGACHVGLTRPPKQVAPEVGSSGEVSQTGHYFGLTAVASSAFRKPFATPTASPLAQKCMKNRRGCSFPR